MFGTKAASINGNLWRGSPDTADTGAKCDWSPCKNGRSEAGQRSFNTNAVVWSQGKARGRSMARKSGFDNWARKAASWSQHRSEVNCCFKYWRRRLSLLDQQKLASSFDDLCKEVLEARRARDGGPLRGLAEAGVRASPVSLAVPSNSFFAI